MAISPINAGGSKGSGSFFAASLSCMIFSAGTLLLAASSKTSLENGSGLFLISVCDGSGIGGIRPLFIFSSSLSCITVSALLPVLTASRKTSSGKLCCGGLFLNSSLGLGNTRLASLAASVSLDLL